MTSSSPLKLEKGFRNILSFTDEMEAHGSQAGSELLAFEIVASEPEVAGALRLTPNEKVVRLQRVRLADYLPMGVESSFLWARLFPDLLRRFDPATSLYRTLAYVYGIQIAAVNEVVEASLANSEQARLLQIAEGSPIFTFRRTSYIHSGQAVEYVESFYRADRYKIVQRLRQ